MAPIQHFKKKIDKTAHYYTYGELNRHTKYLWFVCHGYAQTAEEFLKNFQHLDPETHFIVAPEGLSRFYQSGFDGKVVASWMTRRHRLDEIGDYSRFIQSLYEEYTKEVSDDVRIVLLGYSQGGSTVYRWITSKYPYFYCFINWAGWIPEDIDYEDCRHYLNSKKNYFVYGLEDKFLPRERINMLSAFTEEKDLAVKFYHFNGRHVIDPVFLQSFIQKHL